MSRIFCSFLIFFSLLFETNVSRAFNSVDQDFEQWINLQEYESWSNLLNNISPSDALPGTVIASPSRSNPDYYYHWVRDAALVMNNVVAELGFSNYFIQEDLNTLMHNYTRWIQIVQSKDAPGGLGEAKYYVNGRPYDLPWGRPQNDGPALRAITLMNWADILLQEGHDEFVFEHLYKAEMPAYSLIKRDLEYVSHQWTKPCFDLWEEVQGEHFYTRLAQLRAMRKGAKLAHKASDFDAAEWYQQQADHISWALHQHFNQDTGYILTTLNTPRSGLDIATILGLLHTFDPQDPLINFSNEWVLSTVGQIEIAFERIYEINKNGPAVAIGRYPEDIYFGGNPWFLTTNAMAEYYYHLKSELAQADVIELTQLNLAFFKRLLGSNTLKNNQILVVDDSLLSKVTQKADAYLKRTKLHIGTGHRMAEQFHRDTGFQLSARDLTWSYASFISAIRARSAE